MTDKPICHWARNFNKQSYHLIQCKSSLNMIPSSSSSRMTIAFKLNVMQYYSLFPKLTIVLKSNCIVECVAYVLTHIPDHSLFTFNSETIWYIIFFGVETLTTFSCMALNVIVMTLLLKHSLLIIHTIRIIYDLLF